MLLHSYFLTQILTALATILVSIMLVALLVLLSLFIFFLKQILFGSSQLPPGPNAWQVLQKLSQLGKQPHIALTNLATTYGPLMSLRLGGQLVVVASSSAVAKKILTTHDRVLSGRCPLSICCKIPRATKSCISFSQECNDTWRFLRGLGQSCVFSYNAVESKADIRRVKLLEMVECLNGQKGEVVELEHLVSTTVVNIISNILVSRNIFDIRRGGEIDRTRALTSEIIEKLSKPGLADLFPVLKGIDFWNNKKGVEIYRKIMFIWKDIVKERRTRRDDNATSSSRDFLDVLLDNKLSDEQINFALMEILVAGTDSTTITCIWLMVELVRHPRVLQRLRNEIEGAFKGNELVDESILTQSQYLQACIKEILRTHIQGPFLVPHRAIEACKVDNYVIPKDCVVLVNAWAIFQDPRNWKDAKSFNPERFIDSKIDHKGTNFEFIPFSAGRRMCPGLNVALKSVEVIVASLVHCFDWSLPNGEHPSKIDIGDKFGVILKTDKPLCLIPSPRQKYTSC